MGAPLIIRARRNPSEHLQQLGGQCEAIYNDTRWPCRIGSRHVHTHWFAFIDDPLGLSDVQLSSLKRTYWIENLPEATILRGAILISGLTALMVALFVAVYSWSRWSKPRVVVATVASGALTLFGMFILALIWTKGLWD